MAFALGSGIGFGSELPEQGILLVDPQEDPPVMTAYCVTFSPDGTRVLATNAREPDRNHVVDSFDAKTGQWLEELAIWPSGTLARGYFVVS